MLEHFSDAKDKNLASHFYFQKSLPACLGLFGAYEGK